jgi:hypothetical protein
MLDNVETKIAPGFWVNLQNNAIKTPTVSYGLHYLLLKYCFICTNAFFKLCTLFCLFCIRDFFGFLRLKKNI